MALPKADVGPAPDDPKAEKLEEDPNTLLVFDDGAAAKGLALELGAPKGALEREELGAPNAVVGAPRQVWAKSDEAEDPTSIPPGDIVATAGTELLAGVEDPNMKADWAGLLSVAGAPKEMLPLDTGAAVLPNCGRMLVGAAAAGVGFIAAGAAALEDAPKVKVEEGADGALSTLLASLLPLAPKIEGGIDEVEAAGATLPKPPKLVAPAALVAEAGVAVNATGLLESVKEEEAPNVNAGTGVINEGLISAGLVLA